MEFLGFLAVLAIPFYYGYQRWWGGPSPGVIPTLPVMDRADLKGGALAGLGLDDGTHDVVIVSDPYAGSTWEHVSESYVDVRLDDGSKIRQVNISRLHPTRTSPQGRAYQQALDLHAERERARAAVNTRCVVAGLLTSAGLTGLALAVIFGVLSHSGNG